MPTVLIALGSNIDPERHLAAAARELARRLDGIAFSPVYRTPPWGYADQPPFLNAVARAACALTAPALLDALQEIERHEGRERSFPNAPRTLDLDLLDYAVEGGSVEGDSTVLESPRLTLPHPRLHERAFVLVPLCDLAPDWRHPLLHRTARELLAQAIASGGRAGIEPAALVLQAK